MKSDLITKDIFKTLSPLEKDIVNILSKKEGYRVHEVYKVLKRKKKVAKSSVSVLLDRLHKRGLVKRDTENSQGGVRFIYYLAENNEDYEKRVIESILNKLANKFGDKAMAYFNEDFHVDRGKKSG